MKIYIEKSHLDAVIALGFEKEFLRSVKKTIELRHGLPLPVLLLDSDFTAYECDILERLGVYTAWEGYAGHLDHLHTVIPTCVKNWLDFAELNKKVKADIARKAVK